MLNRFQSLASLLFVVSVIPGCGTTGGTFSVHEGRYRVYDCNQLKDEILGQRNAVKQMRELMAKAESGTGGALVNLLAYRTDYDQAVSRMNEAQAEAARKNCPMQGLSGSDRSVY